MACFANDSGINLNQLAYLFAKIKAKNIKKFHVAFGTDDR